MDILTSNKYLPNGVLLGRIFHLFIVSLFALSSMIQLGSAQAFDPIDTGSGGGHVNDPVDEPDNEPDNEPAHEPDNGTVDETENDHSVDGIETELSFSDQFQFSLQQDDQFYVVELYKIVQAEERMRKEKESLYSNFREKERSILLKYGIQKATLDFGWRSIDAVGELASGLNTPAGNARALVNIIKKNYGDVFRSLLMGKDPKPYSLPKYLVLSDPLSQPTQSQSERTTIKFSLKAPQTLTAATVPIYERALKKIQSDEQASRDRLFNSLQKDLSEIEYLHEEQLLEVERSMIRMMEYPRIFEPTESPIFFQDTSGIDGFLY